MASLIVPGYVVEGLIEEGGFSGVYKVTRVHDKKILALKVLTPKAAQSFNNKWMLYKEAKFLQKLNHRNIIKTEGMVNGAPRPAFVMEFFESQTLKALVKHKSPLIEQKGMAIFRQALSALKYMHDHKIIHKDIKPENILVSSEGNIRLIDLTLAEKLGFFSVFRKRKREGTPTYMSPEQVLRKRLDYRSDIYSLGATFYETFCGAPHIVGISEKDVLQKQLRGSAVAKLRKYNKAIPYQIENIIMRMMEKRPEKRFQNIGEIMFELNRFSGSQRDSLS